MLCVLLTNAYMNVLKLGRSTDASCHQNDSALKSGGDRKIMAGVTQYFILMCTVKRSVLRVNAYCVTCSVLT